MKKKLLIGFGILMLLYLPYTLAHKEELDAQREERRMERMAAKDATQEPTGKPTEGPTNTPVPTNTPKPTKTPEQKAAKKRKKLQEAFKEKYGGYEGAYSDNRSSIPWKSYTYSSSATASEIAVEYCKAFFEADNEVHVLVNLGLKTTSIVKKVSESEIEVRTYEYQDGDERYCVQVGGGHLLKEEYLGI